MRERLLEFLQSENKSSAQLAEEIGVQASGISHILSGRNNPSLDFILKMLEKYKFLSTDWLLFGKGSIYKEPKMPNLFDFEPVTSRESNEIQARNEQVHPETDLKAGIESKTIGDSRVHFEKSGQGVIKIVWFYENNSFREFFPL
jgi:transcriptional regulator with XRE-family HTH domain